MSKIRKLDASVYNKIAAGEVVERPASVVKELVENALDAGADAVDITVIGGGLIEITVTDNGTGIEKEDIITAFLPHATSKLRNAEELENISSLGFRGEALASIAAVSHVSIKSRFHSEENGNMVQIKGGETVSQAPCGLSIGTVVTVSNLFYNTPARLKFLKKPRLEEGEITSLVTKLILANPKIRFTYSNEEGILLASEGKGLQSALESVYDSELCENLVPINNIKGSYAIRGYISNTDYSKANKTYQLIVLNGRIVYNQTISTAIHTCYSAYLMKRRYPVTVINIEMPYDEVDVNVHPAKTDVRFRDESKMFGFVFSSLKAALTEAEKARALCFYSKTNDDVAKSEAVKTPECAAADIAGEEQLNDANSSTVIENDTIRQTNKYSDIFESNENVDSLRESSSGVAKRMAELMSKLNKTPQNEDLITDTIELEAFQKEMAITDYRIIGQLFSTFILIESGNAAYIIDQHAAAERILYERLYSEYIAGEIAIQPMLIPYIFSVNASETAIITEKLEELNAIGLDIEPFGYNTFKISAVPLTLLDLDFERLVIELLSDAKTDLTREKLIMTACKSAIKGNTALNEESIRLLFSNLFDKELPASCPHGRPAYIKLTKSELERMFKRII